MEWCQIWQRKTKSDGRFDRALLLLCITSRPTDCIWCVYCSLMTWGPSKCINPTPIVDRRALLRWDKASFLSPHLKCKTQARQSKSTRNVLMFLNPTKILHNYIKQFSVIFPSRGTMTTTLCLAKFYTNAASCLFKNSKFEGLIFYNIVRTLKFETERSVPYKSCRLFLRMIGFAYSENPQDYGSMLDLWEVVPRRILSLYPSEPFV